ncbi:MAG: amidase [Thalassobaculum sp.]|uniref:amidase n=1 Tax=Thalassobaculum sp. TaxID=2022740 RepID=UPI0032ECD58B
MTAETLTATEAAQAMADGRLTAVALVTACLDRIAARDDAVRAWLHLDRDGALAAAADRDAERAAGRLRGPLHGVPFGVKDVIDVAGLPCTHNSPLHRDRVAADDAGCVAVLRAAGAIPLGKTDTVEFAAAGNLPATRNPHDPARTAGGSSSGSGAAVADLQVPVSFGTQTGGSVIRPAAYCGCYALKPTWGAVSREGAKLYSATLDTIGWYARSVADLALVAGVLDLPVEPPRPLQGLRVALCRSPYADLASEAAHAALDAAVRAIEAAGAIVVERELPPSMGDLNATKETIMGGEGRAAFLPTYRVHGDGLNDRLRAHVENRKGITPAGLRAALDHAAQSRVAFEAYYRDVDVVLSLAATGEADPVAPDHTGSPLLNALWTLLHTPVVSIPAGDGPNGLPLAVQLIGFRHADGALLAAADAVARVVDPRFGKVRVPG